MAQLTIQQTFALAVRHHEAGQLREAEQLYQQILARQPEHGDAMHCLGVIAHQMGRSDISLELIRRAISLGPGNAKAYNNLGNVLKDRGQFDEAIAAYRQAIALRPDYSEAYSNLGVALKESGQADQAIAACHRAISLKPTLPEAHSNLGIALREQGQFDDAIAAFDQAIVLRPDYAEAHSHRGAVFRDRGQLDEAIASCRQAIRLKPGYGEAHNNLGIALKDQGQPDEAITAIRQAIALRPGYAEAYTTLGSALQETGRLDEALAAYRQALALKPNYAEAHGNLVFALHYHLGFDAQAIADEQRRWNRRHAEPLRNFIPAHSNDRSAGRRLRIGYVSPDFRDHVVGRNLLPLFHHHDREQFEIICYAQVPRPDAMTHQFQQKADGWRNTVGLTDHRLAEQVCQDRIDVLVDLALHTAGNRLLVFARKPAPVQMTFAGYPGSTGLTAIDYRLTDRYLDPPDMDESVYSERTIRLPDSFWCYDPLEARGRVWPSFSAKSVVIA